MEYKVCYNILVVTVLIITTLVCDSLGEQDAFELYKQSKTGVLNSFPNLTRWAGYERKFYRSIAPTIRGHNDCPRDHESRNTWEKIESYIEDYESSTLQHLEGLNDEIYQSLSDKKLDEHAASNLILNYRMTNRLAKYGESLKDFVSISLDMENSFSCNNETQQLFDEEWPGESENFIMIFTLLSTYKFHDLFVNPENLVFDLTSESQTPAQLTTEMVYAVSKMALEEKDYVQAFDWINYALKLNSWGDLGVSKSFLLEKKEKMIYMHNFDRQANPDDKSQYYLKNIAVKDANTLKEKDWVRTKASQAHFYRGPEYSEINMWSLCAKENTQSESIKAKLKCYLDNKRHPFYYIKPLRVEFHSESPLILQFHDIVGDKLLKTITEDFDNSYKRMSGVGDLKVNDSVTASDYMKTSLSIRNSVNAWFGDEFYPELTFITEIVTGMKTVTPNQNHSEKFQAVEYVPARSYTLHVDHAIYLTDEDIEEEMQMGGSRIATLLYYLNDVPKGGHTAFLNAGVAVPPKKGSAVYWPNFYRNGTARLDTWHSSCPVLLGRKLVINKWFRSFSQFRTFPCSLNKYE